MPLTDTTIPTARLPAKTLRLFDGVGGLYLELNPAGGGAGSIAFTAKRSDFRSESIRT